ncbi:radiation-inducible immediate-early gene IEX-1 [Pelobates cultripes]|nr:radiation-inducible immediate-early gene IEX-1 [Pelobates cultripes]
MPGPRSGPPQVFTFDVAEAAPPAPRRAPVGSRARRPRRVLYPAKARRYLPAPKPDWALRCLYLLCLTVMAQICCEEEVEAGILLPEKVVLLQTIQPALRHNLTGLQPALQESGPQPALRHNLTSLHGVQHNMISLPGLQPALQESGLQPALRHNLTGLCFPIQVTLSWQLYHQR